MADTSIVKTQLEEVAKNVLNAIDRPRDKDVIERRFGLTGKRETLEAVGLSMRITRERVRQIEKATLIRIKISLDNGKNPEFDAAEMELVKALHELGRTSHTEILAKKLLGDQSQQARGAVTLIAELSGKMLVTTENDRYHSAVLLTDLKDEKEAKKEVDRIVELLKNHGSAVTPDEFFKVVAGKYEHPSEVVSIAAISKQVISLDGKWGLMKWPTVNPKNIRDKVYIVLNQNNRKPMHFSEIASGIKARDFKRNNITNEAIHNELIKDARFVLVGRGIYALSEWGYEKGSIADVIAKILKKNSPMHRDDIVREVLKIRKVREATILLNLTSRSEFKRVNKGEYILVEVGADESAKKPAEKSTKAAKPENQPAKAAK